MKNVSISAIVMLLLVGPMEASAQPSVWTIHSSTCEAINPAQSQKMEWRETGLVNNDPSRSLWVMCPVMSKYFNTPSPDSYIGIVVGNDSSQPMPVNCILRVLDLQSARLKSYSMKKIVNPGDVGSLEWELTDQSIMLPSIACNLPPKGVVAGMVAGFVAF